MPQLTVEEIGKILDEGGSVFVKDSKGQTRHVTSRDRMPTEADLAKGDEAVALQTLESSREVGGFKKGQFEALEKKVESLVAEAQKRNDDAARGFQAQIDELKAKLASTKPAQAAEPAKSAPAPVAPVAPPRAPEVKAK